MVQDFWQEDNVGVPYALGVVYQLNVYFQKQLVKTSQNGAKLAMVWSQFCHGHRLSIQRGLPP